MAKESIPTQRKIFLIPFKMYVNPQNILTLLQKYFSKYNNETPIIGPEINIAKNFSSEIERCLKHHEEMEHFEDLVFDENADYVEIEGQIIDSDFDYESDEQNEPESPFGSEKSSGSSFFPSPVKKMARDDIVSYSEKKNALQFYRSAEKGHRSLSSMQTKFRFIKSESDLKMLRRFETNMKSKNEALKRIDEQVKEKFVEKLEQNLSLSDHILRKWAIGANQSLGQNKILDFKASKNWVSAFKKRHRIVSRKITKFISKKHFVNLEKIEDEVERFVNDVRHFVFDENIELFDTINADQSGFELELHAKRTLAPIGTKLVECVVQSVASTTHSYTIMPMVTASGQLLSPLFIVIAERQGRFPQKGFSRPKMSIRWQTQVTL